MKLLTVCFATTLLLIAGYGCKKESLMQEPAAGNTSHLVTHDPDLQITLEGVAPRSTYYFWIGRVTNEDTVFTPHVVRSGYEFKADIVEDNDMSTNVPIELNTTYIVCLTICSEVNPSSTCGLNYMINEYLSVKYTDINHGKAVLKFDVCNGGKFELVSKGEHIDTEIGLTNDIRFW
jgi:hypothetical protein